jgi:hypothetical protein
MDADQIDVAAIEPPTLESLTFGEMAELERQSGRPMTELMAAGPMTITLVALWVSESRSSARPRSWQELAALRPYVRPSSPSQSRRVGRPARSNGSGSATSSTSPS